MKRDVEIVIISDVHLGTYGCKAKELLRYLNAIRPKTLILNGDIIDIWQFKKSYFPKSHLKVVKKLISFATKGTDVFYITGNHDEAFRSFTDFKLGKLKLCNKHILKLGDKKAWIFHGDVFGFDRHRVFLDGNQFSERTNTKVIGPGVYLVAHLELAYARPDTDHHTCHIVAQDERGPVRQDELELAIS